jgi:hypothetical protein
MMSRTASAKADHVSGQPVKSFFVSMLTRDIDLDDAVLDLLDNCVDGIIRSRPRQPGADKPYKGRWAKIDFDRSSFRLSDNCGGIPWSLHDYAFHMGRPEGQPHDKAGSVGTYGIGMKRALFKMGMRSAITTRNGRDSYRVEIPPEWVNEPDDWNFPVKHLKRVAQEEGTEIIVSDLRPDIAYHFSDSAKAFQSELDRMISTHYALILDKGLRVSINGNDVKPRQTRLVFTRRDGARAIRPFFFRTTTADGVEVFLAVGFTQPIPSGSEAQEDAESKRHSSEDAGWTVVCNDRAVVYCDRSELTGWGEAGIPRYHTQFIAISGIVEFRSSDAAKLPTTTTKRGIDAASTLYLQVKNKMRDGMRDFTRCTTKWKGRAPEFKRFIDAGDRLTLAELKSRAADLHMTATPRFALGGEQYRPSLPETKRVSPRQKHISYYKDVDDIRSVATHLGMGPDSSPSLVGESCFDLMLREAER